MEITETDCIRLEPFRRIIEANGLGTLPQTDVAKYLFHEMSANELLHSVNQTPIYDNDLLQEIKMSASELREAQKQALFLHIMLMAKEIISNGQN